MRTTVAVTVEAGERPVEKLLAPIGMPTPHQTPVGFSVEGGTFSLVGEPATGQMAALIEPTSKEAIAIRYEYAEGGCGYPEQLFTHRPNRYTIAAGALVAHAREVSEKAGGGLAGMQALACEAANQFVYGHPERRFYDDHGEIPHLACGATEGSCIDINTYFIAALRAAGFTAGYVTGYFFPQEKQGCCDDMHCWVVTRHRGEVLEWDIAHHLKLGTRDIHPGLNPKPGRRVALAHSMALQFHGLPWMKLLSEPVWVGDEPSAGGVVRETSVTIVCQAESRGVPSVQVG